ncbi:molybdopterin-dependent oxidoreductase [Nocardioides sp. CN2-186]|uniref:molybdopterin-dependent oxidoreductase n=1 Tax=Nocardioides tweenelious TaxID=3156607 RepID=UPI0032B47A01
MRNSRGAWSVAGLIAGFAGLAASYFVAMVMTIRDSPTVAVAELVIRLTPGGLAERAIRIVGHKDKPLLLIGIFVISALLFAWAGRLARRNWWAPTIVFAVLAVIGGIAVWSQRGATALDILPVAVGFATWLVCLSLLTEPLHRHELAVEAAGADDTAGDHNRRAFLIRAGIMVAAAGTLGVVGRAVGRSRRHVEEARRLLRLPGVTTPVLPDGVRVGVEGITPWMVRADSFYRVDTAIVVPAIEPTNWQLRIHGMVDRELTLTYQDLLNHEVTQAWVTLNCVSNEVDGDLVGNAWWSGVRIADLLRLAGVQDGADAVLQTSDDGWTCGTPLSALTDDRDAILAIAMNGDPLPIDHGFPVRTIVPGLYGYVSACKWVVEMKVTRFADISAYWTDRGWSEQGPVKMASRIDVPRDGGDIASTGGRVGGVAWMQHTGISAVQVQVDGGAWQPAELGTVPSTDTWVQWAATIDVEPGHHRLAVRAVDKTGQVQTSVVRDVLPDGSTGLHVISFNATEASDG